MPDLPGELSDDEKLAVWLRRVGEAAEHARNTDRERREAFQRRRLTFKAANRSGVAPKDIIAAAKIKRDNYKAIMKGD